MPSKPWHDPETLRKLYHGKGLSSREVADKLGCSQQTVLRWLKKHGIEVESKGREIESKHPVLDSKEKLRKLYVDEKLSSNEIAEKIGVDQRDVISRLGVHGIETRSMSQAQMNRGNGGYGLSPNGYPWIHTTDNDGHIRVHIHQLVGIAKGYDPHKVFSNGEHHIHHKNEVKWDNRPTNLEMVTAKEHMQKHG